MSYAYTRHAPSGPVLNRRHRLRTAAQIVAVLAAAWAVVGLCRWGNRWYIATQWLDSTATEPQGVYYLQTAHASLVSALIALLVAITAAAIGWRLRVIRKAI